LLKSWRGLLVLFDNLSAEAPGEKVGEKVGERLTKNQKGIVEGIKSDGTISAKALSERVGISQRKIEENIKKLKERNIIRRVGPDKGGRWEII
jgi:ATP-dependent DNA helicase RecG